MKIDLHGMIENEAIGAILTALISFEESDHDELEFITGDGNVLKDVAIDILNDEGWHWEYNGSNLGSLIVTK